VDNSRSEELFARAQKVTPGGVNSPVRAFRGVGGTPRFIARGEGARLIDVDGNSYIDYICSWGPLLLGHRPKEVIEALQAVLEIGTSFGAPTEREIELAELIRLAKPSMELVRLVNSGTEATMSALRVARGFTGRDLTLKFEGCYHGHVDSLLVKAGSGMATLAISDTVGVPQSFAATTIVVPFNDLDAVEAAFREQGDKIACVILEPVVGNMGCVPPQPGFLEGLRAVTERHGALLVFDEVMTGWRVHRGGAQALYGIEPDVTCMGKVLGGGFPAAAYGGRRELMEMVAPAGPVYQAGTLSGNPVAMAAGLATLEVLERAGIWESAAMWAAAAEQAYTTAAHRAGVPLTVQRVGTMLTPFFTAEPVRNFADAKRTDRAGYARFFHAMLDAGIYLPPSPFEASFTSAVHGDAELERLEAALTSAFAIS
jgi:glutamate-1-semialdehyde 2,1-aminomutase